MKLSHIIFLLIIGSFLNNCTVEPTPINYGQDACFYCKMNIVDRQYAAEIVSNKGKTFKYDAIECMMQDLRNWSKDDIAFYLMTDYNTPGKLIDAQTGRYLISENLPSPMGAHLTGFENDAAVEKIQQDKGGVILNWKELKEKYELDSK